MSDAPSADPTKCPLSWGWYVKVFSSIFLLAIFIIASALSIVEEAGNPGVNWPRLSGWNYLWLGQLVAVLGLIFYSISYASLRQQMAGTLSRPECLVTRGFPWSRIRHPMYLADLIWLGGFALMAGWPWSTLVWVVACIGAWIQLEVEDDFMAKQFPAQHSEWKSRSGKLLPMPGL